MEYKSSIRGVKSPMMILHKTVSVNLQKSDNILKTLHLKVKFSRATVSKITAMVRSAEVNKTILAQ